MLNQWTTNPGLNFKNQSDGVDRRAVCLKLGNDASLGGIIN